ncbi:MAG: M43 family zinc metalloprotease [Bacteroidota bacterium]
MWVCDLFGNKLGYSQFPGGGDYETDGVVLDYLTVGRTYNGKFGLGRTATHEVGHWLNLRHIWGDGGCDKDDGVADTPLSGYPTFGCQPDKTSCGSLDMTANFMDYSDDACMNLFTEGQKDRMRALFSNGGFRAALLRTAAFGEVEVEPEDTPKEEEEGCPNGQNCKEEEPDEIPDCANPTQLKASFGTRQLNLSWQGNADAYTFELKLPNATRWYTFSTPRNQLSISGVTSAMVGEARLKAECADGKTSAYVYFEIGSGRLSQVASDVGLVANPNPVQEELFVEWQQADVHFNGLNFKQLEEPQRTLIELYDRSGRMVMRKEADPGQYNMMLSVSNLNAGLYFLMQRSQDGQILGSLKVQVL